MRKLGLAVAMALVAFGTNSFAQTCPAAPQIVSPAPNATNVPTFVNLRWTDVGAGSYDVFLGPAGSGCSGSPAGTSTTNSFNPPQLSPNTIYEWKVRAIRGACPMVESPCVSFKTLAENNCPTATASPVAPAANAQFNEGQGVTLSWNPVANATGYDVLLSADGQTASVVASTTTTNVTLNGLTERTYFWAIRSNFAAPCPPTVSSASSFRVVRAAACGTDAPALRSPADNATVDAGSVTFEWSPVANATGYRLFFLTANTSTPVLAYSGTDARATIANLAGGGSLVWFVQATFAGTCSNTESSRRTLNVRAASNCPAAPVTLTSPTNGATNVTNPVTFRWNAVANARTYVVLGSVDGGSFEIFGTTTNTSLEAIVPAGIIKWLVIAKADNCSDVRSTVFEFTAVRPTCSDASITLRSPANNATVTSPVRFEWTAVSDATAYRLYVSMAGGPMDIVARTTAPEATVSLPAGAGVWKVEALRGACGPVVSGESRFNVSAAANCGNNAAPAIVSPAGTQNAPAAVTSPVTLRWSGVANAIAYRVWLSRNGQAPSDIALTKNTEVTRLLDEEGIYYFFVEALFEGCPSTRSGNGFFQLAVDRCGTGTPAIITPANGSTVNTPITFTWGAVDRAKAYRVIASLNGGQNFVAGETTDTTLTRVLPPGTITYAIEAVFEQCPSRFSARTTFTIPESQNCPTTPPQLVAPSNGATAVTLPVTLDWNAINNAIRYVVVLRFNDGAPIPVTETTETQYTIRNLPGGRFEWFVLAFVPGCRPIESAHFTFAIDAPENCPTAARPLVFEPATGSVLLATQVDFDWSDVPNATGYRLYGATGEGTPNVLASTNVSRATVDVPVGAVRFFVEALFSGCPSTHSAPSFFIATSQAPPCRTPATPRANVIGTAVSGTDYTLRWTPLANVDLFEVQESASADFSNATTQTVDGISATFRHTVETPAKFFYRVRGISNCSDERGEFSNVVGTIVAPQRTSGTSRNASAEIGTIGTIVQTHFVPGAGPGATFRATVDKPWLTLQPASGALPENGITLNVVADPKVLAFGTNTATVSVEVTTPTADGVSSEGTSTSKVPFSISLVTPVTPGGKSSPPPESLIIPAVAHAVGANDSQFESDIRVTNLGATTAKYQVNFTPSGVDGTTTGTSSTIEVAPNETTALDDILETMFGTGTTSVVGMLEIRPLTSSTSSTSFVTTTSGTAALTTVASSRTYNVTPTGTFGQYIPAIPFSQFVGKGAVLSLQQIAQSDVYRTNFGFAEASGEAAELVMRVYDTQNALVATIPVSLKASEHKQINSMLAANGITNLKDGRVEVEVTSSTGKVTAYASGVDNTTNDPLLVSPVVVSSVSANRFVVPGVALLNTGIANWRTDMRVFNGGSTATTATLTFYPQGNPGAPVAKDLVLNPGQIAVLDNVLESFFAQANPNPGGSVIVSTAANSPLVATARTYNQTSAGTYGQFVPGVTPSQAVGLNERSLQILQLEHSSRIRTNVGISETNGKSARVEVSLILPDSKATPVIAYDLAPNEFRQISLASFGLGDSLYNVRATVRVVSGEGRVTAYGSAIDQLTQDPTYVPGI